MAGSTRSAALRQLGRIFEGGTVSGLDDRELLGRFLDRRDEIAFAAIVERHGPMVLGVCRAVLKDAGEVEDAFQATFLVLVRKARSIRGGDTLGGWLHRVAYRIAVQAAADIARRRNLEQRAGELAAMKTDLADFPDDLRALLHEEIDRLPENFRLAIVLCDLDGLGRPDAARQLGWSEGELRGRLARARSKLRDRLTRRGLAVTSGLLAEALARESSAAVPRTWVDVLVKAAATLPTGKIAATGGISATAAKLAQATLAGLAAESARGIATVGALLIALGLVGSHTIPTGFAQSDEGEMKKEMPGPKPASVPSLKPLAPRADEDRARPVTFAGIVLDPDGRPFAGAKISLASSNLKQIVVPLRTRATSGSDGRFRFDVPIDEFDRTFEAEPWLQAPVLAGAQGFASGLANLTKEGQDLTLRLTRDVPIEGRIIDIQGKPVQGASIRVLNIDATEEGDLTQWLKSLDENRAFYVGGRNRWLTRHLGLGYRVSDDPPTHTDADGRFILSRIGRERVAELRIEGPSIETIHVRVRTRPGEAIRVAYEQETNLDKPVTIYGSSFTHVAHPSQPIEGVVRDIDTGQPLAGILVCGDEWIGSPTGFTSTFTDANGHYRLDGVARGREDYLMALSPAEFPSMAIEKPAGATIESLPYLRARLKIPGDVDPQTRSIRFDIALKRGILVTGRVLDAATMKPAPAVVEYMVLNENPWLKQAPGERLFRGHNVRGSRLDGTYTLLAYPGPGLITVKASEHRFQTGAGAENLKLVKIGRGGPGRILGYPTNTVPEFYHCLKLISPREGDRPLSRDLELKPSRSLSLEILDPDGKPLAGTDVRGIHPTTSWVWTPLGDATRTEIFGLEPGKGGRISARHEEKHLVGVLDISGDEQAPLRMTLKPWGEMTGRLVDSDGKPWTGGGTLRPHGSWFMASIHPTPVAKDGRFRITGLLPSVGHGFYLTDDRNANTIAFPLIKDVLLKPGEVKDVGDVTIEPRSTN